MTLHGDTKQGRRPVSDFGHSYHGWALAVHFGLCNTFFTLTLRHPPPPHPVPWHPTLEVCGPLSTLSCFSVTYLFLLKLWICFFCNSDFVFFLVVIFWCALTWSVSTPVFSLKQSSRALLDYHNSRTGNATEVSSTKSLETFLAAWEQLEAADTIINLNSETSNELQGYMAWPSTPDRPLKRSII